MALRNFENVPYLPMLGVRSAEMSALKELPTQDKNLLLPVIGLRRWVSSHNIASSIARVGDTYGDRPLVLELGDEEPVTGVRRAVHDTLDELRDPNAGYSNWFQFVEEWENAIPALQIADLNEIRTQLQRFERLGRGVVVRLPEFAHVEAHRIAQLISSEINSSEVLILLDYERQTRLILNRQAHALGIMEGIWQALPAATVSLSASSFPDSFVDLNSQEIFERQFFDGLQPHLRGRHIVYSDRGSARVERGRGGSGSPAPRIDLANTRDWQFFREECEDGEERFPYYQRAAMSAMESAAWDPNLRVWGCQMIERTAQGDPSAIYHAGVSTAARINMHLHRQLYRDDIGGLYDTEEDWDG